MTVNKENEIVTHGPPLLLEIFTLSLVFKIALFGIIKILYFTSRHVPIFSSTFASANNEKITMPFSTNRRSVNRLGYFFFFFFSMALCQRVHAVFTL